MLALTRKRGESIMIGDDVEVVVLSVQGEQIKIGILAPKSVSVHRKEIYEQIQNENKEAVRNVKVNIGEMKQLLKKDINNNK